MIRMPIETIREGNKITKICLEDVYKIINRVQEDMTKTYNKSIALLDSIHKETNGYEGEIIVGTGVSQPCMSDAFDEEIGNNIAFMKSKLNANIKKHNFLMRLYKFWDKYMDKIAEEISDIDFYIKRDLNGIRKHNPDYLTGIEEELSII